MLWVLSLHVISMVAWFAGLFYLPRLFVYHSQQEAMPCKAVFKTMEYKLYYYIMTPAAIATTLFGIALIFFSPNFYLKAGWFHLKILLVLALWGFHLYCGCLVKRLAKNDNPHSEKFYRVFNEVPTLVLVLVIILVVVKPF